MSTYSGPGHGRPRSVAVKMRNGIRFVPRELNPGRQSAPSCRVDVLPGMASMGATPVTPTAFGSRLRSVGSEQVLLNEPFECRVDGPEGPIVTSCFRNLFTNWETERVLAQFPDGEKDELF